ncbi:MAG: OsmC family protein [Bacteroidia bacterium]
MAQHAVASQWMGKMQFNALVNDHVIIMDAPERGGGEDNGSIPKPFILTALTGCAGMELLVVLKKNNIVLKELNIKATGELTKQIPFHYTEINVDFEIKANEEDKTKIVESVDLMMSSICGVSYMLQKIMPVVWQVKFQ